LLGVGGGVIFVFVLSIYFQNEITEPHELPRWIIANSIFATFFAGLSGSVKNFRSGAFYFREVLLTAIPGAISALAIAWSITEYHWYNKQKFTFFFVGLVLLFFYRLVFKDRGKDHEHEVAGKAFVFPLIGFFSGIVSALSGLGGGVVMIPLLRELRKVRLQKAASISLGVIPVFAFTMSIFFLLMSPAPNGISQEYTLGYIDLKASLSLALGVVVAAPFGVKTARRLSQRLIKVMFATLLLIVALKLIYSAIQ